MLPELTADRFPEFFQELWGTERKPFAWQTELASRALNNSERPWPEVIALPTASGKTACLDIAVYALAAQAKRRASSQPRTAPRRIFFVVDRRVIVDEAFERAQRLSDKLRSAQGGILREVADRLRSIGGGERPLACFQLRGGMYRSDAWARSPTQPTIVASTVDQLGSRLLFRAYGRSFKAWPIHAGLSGNDVLVLLDEAHCAVPFMETLQAVRRFRGWGQQPFITPFHVTIMSATPPEGATDIFRDSSEEPGMADHPLGARQLANKPTRLVEVQTSISKANDEFAGALAKTAEDLAGSKPVAVVIFTNRVATARTTHRLLVEKHRSRAILLTGRMRPFDKDDTLAGKLAGLSADFSSTRQLDSQLFVVATQTLEVGANLDFDMLVTECASLDALRQRFGRLNRIGRKIESRAAILIRADQAKGSDDDPVYGPALASTWHWLKGQANERDEIDMGISSLSARLNGEEAPLNAPTNHAPVMLPAHIDRWAQTAPEPFPTPDISLFLHGPGRVSADVQVCWRADIDLNFPESAMETLAICPPAVGECLPVPIGFFRRWLQGDDPSATSVTDVEGTAEEEAEQPAKSPGAQARRVLRWCGREDALILSEAQNLKPGDVVVIPLVLGGWNSMGDLLQEEGLPVADWGDRAYVSARAKSLLRLHPAVVSQWPDFRSKQALLELAGQAKMLFEEDPDEFLTRLRELLKNIIMDETAHGPMKWMKLVAESITGESGMIRKIMLHPSGEGVILRGTQQLHQQEGDSFSDEDDSSASGTTTIGLSSHLHGVSDFSAEFGALCDLPSPLIEAISCAGLLHDTGKADARFQSLLRKSSPWLRGELLAKSDAMPQGWAAYRRACKIANYPVGGRHEMLSARLAENAIELLPGNVDLQELVLHLVASHHGHCRPFAPVVRDSDPIEVVLEFENLRLAHSSRTGMERIDSGAAERFWSLTRRYGWWGLAYLEAILRLADHRRSEWEEANHDKNGSNGN